MRSSEAAGRLDQLKLKPAGEEDQADPPTSEAVPWGLAVDVSQAIR